MKDRRRVIARSWARGWFVSALLLVGGCSAPSAPAPTAPTECAAGEFKLPDETCQLAGVPPEACGQGFLPDSKQGCEPILPPKDCPFGTMAILGETQCHEVAPCGEGTWGDIPADANTQFVDQAYPGSDSDGSMAKPWKTIQEAIFSAKAGATVAVAAGKYVEDVRIQGKPVRLWGRCPAMVEVAGTVAKEASILVAGNQASGTEVHGIGITGEKRGLAAISFVTNVLAEHVWIHDAVLSGVHGEGTANVTVKNSMVEQNRRAGINVIGAEAIVESTVVRATQQGADGVGGAGVQLIDDQTNKQRANVTVRGSHIENNILAGILVLGSDAVIEASLIRATQSHPLVPNSGNGVYIQGNSTGKRANVTVRASRVTESHAAGVFVSGADALFETSVFHATQPSPGGNEVGAGIYIRGNSSNGHSNVDIRSCLVEQNTMVGIVDAFSDVTIESTIVRTTQVSMLGLAGTGIQIQHNTDNPEDRAKATIRTSLVEENHQAGVVLLGADVTFESTVVRDTAASSNGQFGDGIVAEGGSIVTLQNIWITGNNRAGLSNFGSDVAVSDSTITCNAFNLEGESFGDVPFSYAGSHGWACSKRGADDCTVLGECIVQSSGLEPPPPLL